MAEPTHRPAGAGSSTIDEAAVVFAALSRSGALSAQSQPRVIALVERFCAFATRAFAIDSLQKVSLHVAKAFVRAPSAAGQPSVATMHLRRSVLRLLFRTARELGLADHDPTLDLVLPPRSSLRARPLTDEEVALCRAASMHSLDGDAAAGRRGRWRRRQLGPLRSATSGLGTWISEQRRVWVHGSSKAEPRWAPLTDWGATQLERRLATVAGETRTSRSSTTGRRGSDYHRQAASCVAIGEVLRRAGLAAEPDVRPVSVTAWVGRQVLAETGRIDEVARRLGMRSLDRTAALIGWDWTDRD